MISNHITQPNENQLVNNFSYNELEIDFFGLLWLSLTPDQSTNMIATSITIDEIISIGKLKETVKWLYSTYPYLQSRLVQRNKKNQTRYAIRYPTSQIISEDNLMIEEVSTTSQEFLRQKWDFTIDLYNEDWLKWHVYYDQEEKHTQIHLVCSHAIGDGATLFFFLQMMMTHLTGLGNNRQLPEINPSQLLTYCRDLKTTRYNQKLGLKIIRYIRGGLYFTRKNLFGIDNQIFNPTNMKEIINKGKIFSKSFEFPPSTYIILEKAKINGYTSNEYLMALLSYSYLLSFGYKKTVVTYPINIRSQEDRKFAVGNIMLANNITLTMKPTFEEFLVQVSSSVRKQKKNTGPHNAALFGKFLKYRIENVYKQMDNNFTAANIRISNAG